MTKTYTSATHGINGIKPVAKTSLNDVKWEIKTSMEKFENTLQDNSSVDLAGTVSGSDKLNNTRASELEMAVEDRVFMDEGENELLDKVQFGKDIKILCIDSAPMRVAFYHLGLTNITDMKFSSNSYPSLMGLLIVETIENYMTSVGFNYLGELNFDNHGNLIPCPNQKWTLKDKDLTFIHTGYRYFKNNDISVCILHSWYSDEGKVSIQVVSKDSTISQLILKNLEDNAKKENCLRGQKLRDINIFGGTFGIVRPSTEYTWDKFYYTDEIIKLFETDVFGFLNNVEQYNARNINKRGLLLWGRPGSGKTSLSNIICNYAVKDTVIWITPDSVLENRRGSKDSIRSLYLLAEYLSPVVVILEDLDLFCEDRDERSDTATLGSLMNVLDGVNTINNAITVATTNRFELIEKALRNRPGRFDRVAEIPSLNKKLRKKMLNDRFSDCKITNEIIEYIAKNSDDWTGAQVEEFVRSVNLYFIIHNLDKPEKRTVTQEIVDDTLKLMFKFSVGGMKSDKNHIGFND